ncbi:MAG: SWIM zinc finger family protein, partial [Undibacterium sp.]|nr:SWIM zinc finger family protein [Undibacterium sp.]
MLTTEQILALAPDAASAKAGSGQANLSYWSKFGANEQALWGLCQGSGKDPYRTQIELATPAFKCSCPSRKFPCKHGLGLYLLYAKHADKFQHEQEAWVAEWLRGREQRQEKKINQVEVAQDLSVEAIASREKSAQKRQDKRETNVAQGIALMETWLRDLASDGLAGLRSKPA